MQNHNKIYIIATVFFITVFSSCQKVIDVNLNSTLPRYVITGNVTNQPAPYTVSITKTVDFSQDNTFPGMTGAIVVITDATLGIVDTLKDIGAGKYQTNNINGVSGHKYQLYINAASNIFVATSTMPDAVTLDSLYTQMSPFGRSLLIVPQYTDPTATGNFYHFHEYVNGVEGSDLNTRNDRLINGQVMKSPIRSSKIEKGDMVQVSLECIDSAVYNYYFTLSQTENQNSATPANPVSNISNGALGYFSAHTVSTKEVIVP